MIPIIKQTALMLASAGLLIASFAEARGPQFYRWTDADGKTIYSDKPPLSARQSGHAVLSGQGSVVSVVAPAPDNPPAEDPEAEKLKALEEEARLREAAKQKKADESLLNAYSSIEELKSVKNSRLMQIESRAGVYENQAVDLQRRIELLMAQVESGHEDLPRNYASELNNLRERLKVAQRNAQLERDKLERTAQKFDVDIARYQKLTERTKQQ